MVLDLRQPKSKSLNIALTCHICKNCDDLFFLLHSRNSATVGMINIKMNFFLRANVSRVCTLKRVLNKLVVKYLTCNACNENNLEV